MYGKFHASAFTGSMRGAGPVRFSVWAYVIANTNQHGVVEINPDIVAFMIGCESQEVREAVAYLQAPDPNSRCKDHEGRRLLKEGEFQYFVPTHEQYRNMKTTEEKREYNRVKKQEERQRKSDGVKPSVKNVKRVNTTEEEEEAGTESKAEEESSSRFTPEVSAFIAQLVASGRYVDPELEFSRMKNAPLTVVHAKRILARNPLAVKPPEPVYNNPDDYL